MKTYIFTTIIAAALVCGGCASTSVQMSPEGQARLVGAIAADVAIHAAKLNAADLALARPVLASAREALLAEPAQRPQAVSQVLDRELAERLTMLSVEDRDVLRLVLSGLLASIVVEAPTAKEEQAAAVAAAFVDGVLWTVDLVLAREDPLPE